MLLQGRVVSLDQIRKLLAVLTGIVCLFSLFVYPNLLPQKDKDPIFLPHTWKPYSYRCDEVFPTTLHARTLQLKSVPTENRIPPEAVSNITHYFSRPQNVAPFREYFFDYNPSIIMIPQHQVTMQSAVYLASFRVSNLGYCFHPGT